MFPTMRVRRCSRRGNGVPPGATMADYQSLYFIIPGCSANGHKAGGADHFTTAVRSRSIVEVHHGSNFPSNRPTAWNCRQSMLELNAARRHASSSKEVPQTSRPASRLRFSCQLEKTDPSKFLRAARRTLSSANCRARYDRKMGDDGGDREGIKELIEVNALQATEKSPRRARMAVGAC